MTQIKYNLLAYNTILNLIRINSLITTHNSVVFSWWFNDIIYYMTTFTINITMYINEYGAVMIGGTIMNNKVNNIAKFTVKEIKYDRSYYSVEFDSNFINVDDSFSKAIKIEILNRVYKIDELCKSGIIILPWRNKNE